MEELLEAYAKKNVFFIHVLGGDQDISLIHFKKHYRLDYPMIPDNLDRYRHIIRVTGISNVAVFDGDGVCIFNESQTGQRLKDFQKVIDKALKEIKGSKLKKKAYVENGTVYAPDVKKNDGRIVHERMPQLAAGFSGELHLVYVSDEGGSNDVFLRTCFEGRWGQDIGVATSKADEYAPVAVALGEGRVLVAYVAQKKGLYQVFTVIVDNGKAKRPKQVSASKDDAMAPSLSRGPDGDVWLAWYEWAKMGEFSRDREIFLSRHKGKSWSKPVQVSPTGVPTYEDHGEPVVCSDLQGGAWVAWTWDYHGTLPQKPPVDENSIFLRHVDKKLKMGEILAAGFRGEGRARDYVPTLTVTSDGKPWVAWDNSHKSSLGYNGKAIFLNRLVGDDFEEQTEVAAHNGQIDSPRLVRDLENRIHLVWAQHEGHGWILRHRQVGSESPAEAREVRIKCKCPRYPSACFDEKGRLWVAYTEMGEKKWKVRAEKLDG